MVRQMGEKNKTALNHYNKNYYSWQKNQNIFGAKSNKFMFNKFIKENIKVLDFGCSSGYFLKQFENISRVGVEVNSSAREIAESNGLICYKSNSLG